MIFGIWILCSILSHCDVLAYSKIDTIKREIKPLEIGDRLPDLILTSLVNFEDKQMSISHLKGKLVILDFWATWCSPCVAAFPKLNDLQKKFKDSIQIIGVTDQNFELISRFYKDQKEKQKLDFVFPSVTDDKLLNNYFPHQTIPHVVWIDKNGVVIAITDSQEVTDINICKAIKGEKLHLREKLDRSLRLDFNLNEAFAVEKLTEAIYINDGVTEGGIKYRSIITKKIDGIPLGSIRNEQGRIMASNVLLESLFMNAHNYDNLSSGENLFPFPTNKFFWEVGMNKLYNRPSDRAGALEFYKDVNNYYCYELVFPDYYNNPQRVAEHKNLKFIASNIMKQDLMKWTGFLSSMQFRKTKVLVLSFIDSSKVISSDKFESSELDPAFNSGTFSNMRMLHFKRSLHHLLQLAPPFIDETNYVGMVNFKLECKLTDHVQLNLELNKFGLQLKEEERIIPVLVITNKMNTYGHLSLP